MFAMANFINQIGGPTILIFIGGIIAAIGAVWSAYDQNQLNERLDKKNEEIIKLNRNLNNAVIGGDSFCYVYPVESSNPYFVLVHSGDHPLYDISFNVRDLDALEKLKPPYRLRDVIGRQANPGNLGAGLTQILDQALLDLTGTSKRYTIQFSARNGSFVQELRMRKTDDGIWHSALRVKRLDAGPNPPILFTKISDGYPKEPDGSIDWH